MTELSIPDAFRSPVIAYSILASMRLHYVCAYGGNAEDTTFLSFRANAVSRLRQDLQSEDFSYADCIAAAGGLIIAYVSLPRVSLNSTNNRSSKLTSLRWISTTKVYFVW